MAMIIAAFVFGVIIGLAPYAIGTFMTNTGGCGGFDLKDEGEDWPNPYYYRMESSGRPPDNLLGLTIQLKKDYGTTEKITIMDDQVIVVYVPIKKKEESCTCASSPVL